MFGTGLARYESGFAESLDLLLSAMAGGGVRADGEHFAFREVPFLPRPERRPRLVVACGRPDSGAVRLAG